MRCKFVLILIGLFLIGSVLAVSDIAVFQGQYFENNEFQEGTYNFSFDIYDDETAGTSCFSDSKTLTTGFWGQWRTELTGISAACNDTTKDYFMEIAIENSTQTPRRRLTHFNYLRKDVDDSTTGDLTISNVLNFLLGGSIQELVANFLISKGLEVSGDLDVNGDATIVGEVNITGDTIITGQTIIDGEVTITSETRIEGQLVCLEDGTNCGDGGNGGTSYVSFISTVDGDLSINNRYLPLGTDSLIALTKEESSWIIDRDLTITGILWHSVSNTRSTTSAITLMKSTTGKNNFIDTDLSVDIRGIEDGSSLNFNVSFSQEDLAVIKYDSGGVGGSIHDLSVTFIGTYD